MCFFFVAWCFTLPHLWCVLLPPRCFTLPRWCLWSLEWVLIVATLVFFVAWCFSFPLRYAWRSGSRAAGKLRTPLPDQNVRLRGVQPCNFSLLVGLWIWSAVFICRRQRLLSTENSRTGVQANACARRPNRAGGGSASVNTPSLSTLRTLSTSAACRQLVCAKHVNDETNQNLDKNATRQEEGRIANQFLLNTISDAFFSGTSNLIVSSVSLMHQLKTTSSLLHELKLCRAL